MSVTPHAPDTTSGPVSEPRRASRRQFGRSVAAAAVSSLAFPGILRARNANEKLNIAIIGAGGRGGSNLASVASENIVVLCDVFDGAVERAAKRFTGARKERDFRRVYDHANTFDAVVVSTTEHTHALATLPALQLGKHVYCEKPLTHDVAEARRIREAAAKAKVATQMGTQIHATDNYRRVVELVQSGAIGDVTEAHVWVGRAWGRQSPEEARKFGDIVTVLERPTGSSPIPQGLDWDLWLGPAPERPFHEVYWPGPKWYRWWDFGNGTMSDLGSHWVDLPFWALKLQAPKTIEAFGPPPHPEIAPASMHVLYEYGPRGSLPATTLTWYQGTHKPDAWTRGEIPKWDSGVLFVGSKGKLLADYGKHVLLPEAQFKDFKRPEPFIPKSLGHHEEWIHACKTGAPTTCHFEYAGLLTEANHLGNVAYRLGKKLEWDTEKMYCPNCHEAEPLLKREYRKGWTLG
ncbi:MAG: Gfo/Idh/MocA family oxidoreductase [Isosphaeraceae bacterium]